MGRHVCAIPWCKRSLGRHVGVRLPSDQATRLRLLQDYNSMEHETLYQQLQNPNSDIRICRLHVKTFKKGKNKQSQVEELHSKNDDPFYKANAEFSLADEIVDYENYTEPTDVMYSENRIGSEMIVDSEHHSYQENGLSSFEENIFDYEEELDKEFQNEITELKHLLSQSAANEKLLQNILIKYEEETETLLLQNSNLQNQNFLFQQQIAELSAHIASLTSNNTQLLMLNQDLKQQLQLKDFEYHDNLRKIIDNHTENLQHLHQEIDYLQTKVAVLESSSQPKDMLLTLDDLLKMSPKNISHYTGCSNQEYLKMFINVLKASSVDVTFNHTGGCKSNASFDDIITMTLVRLRQGFSLTHLLFLFPKFGSRSTIARQFRKMALCIEVALKRFQPNIPIKQHQLVKNSKFHDLQYILDGVEVPIDKPKGNCFLVSCKFSAYKGYYTAKFLIAIGPDFRVRFVSVSYCGNTSDVEAVHDSGFLDLIKPNDGVMVDKGFKIYKAVKSKGGHLYCPVFLTDGSLSPAEIQESKEISTMRVHIERAICRMKYFKILDHVCPDLQIQLDNLLYITATISSYFRNPLVREKDDPNDLSKLTPEEIEQLFSDDDGDDFADKQTNEDEE